MKSPHPSPMKRILSIVLVCILVFVVSCERVTQRSNEQEKEVVNDYDYKIQVIRISDGDTFVGKTQEGIEIRFRLYGIDAPEKKQPFSKKSTQKLSELIYNTQVEITVKTKQDKYGRPIVIVKNEDGIVVNEELLRLGLAWHYKYFDDTKKYADLEQQAKDKKIGLWQDKNPEAPWDYRHNKKTKNSK